MVLVLAGAVPTQKGLEEFALEDPQESVHLGLRIRVRRHGRLLQELQNGRRVWVGERERGRQQLGVKEGRPLPLAKQTALEKAPGVLALRPFVQRPCNSTENSDWPLVLVLTTVRSIPGSCNSNA